MAVLQMQRICICSLKEQRKAILEILQRKGVVEINDVYEQDNVFSKVDVSSAESVFEKSSIEAGHALEILEKFCAEKSSLFSMFEGRKEIELEEYDEFSRKIKSVDIMDTEDLSYNNLKSGKSRA